MPLYKSNKMKKNIFSLFLLFVFGLTQAQITADEDGKYYADNNKLYNGTYNEFFNNGNLRMAMELKDGLADGQTYIYSESGILLETRSYSAGKFNGTWLTYNNEGVKIAEAHYLNNKKDGKWLIWDNEGRLRFEMFYASGAKTGTWREWDEAGTLIKEKIYE